MVYRPSVTPNLAFVLIPFKAPFDSYYEEIIRPAAKLAGLDTRKADEIYSTGPIIQDIWKQIWTAAVVIADVTDKNPNVNYELGICHTLGVPTVIIAQNLDDVPFDYRHRRYIPYNTRDVDWQRKLKRSITATLKQVLAGEDIFPELSWPYDTSPLRRDNDQVSLVPATDVRSSIVHGVQMVRDAVAYAFGPHGAHVSVNVGENQHSYYRKGTAIASSIHSSQRFEQIGIHHAQELAQEMRDQVGDGSKTALLLFHQMLASGTVALKHNYSPSDVLKGMERAAEAVVGWITSQSKTPSRELLLHVARTAARGDAKIADVVTAAFEKAGKDGLVVIERSSTGETMLEAQEGMYFDRGYVDPALVLPAEGPECILENPYVLIYDRKISAMAELLPVLEQVATANRPLLIIADDIDGEALATLVVNRRKGTLNCIAVKAPGYAERRKALLQDLAVLTDGTAITSSAGRSLANTTIQELGRARKAVISKDNTTLIGGAGESKLDAHLANIREELLRTTDPYAVEKLRERLAKLGGAIVAIRIAGLTPQDVTDTTYLTESAMHSVQKTIEEGCVWGGGLALFRATEILNRLSFKKPGEVAGVTAINEALREPLRQLVINRRLDAVAIIKKVRRSRAVQMGFNSDTEKVQDLTAVGVLDPVATVTRCIQLASAHARTLLETGAWERPNDTEHSLSTTEEQTQLRPHD